MLFVQQKVFDVDCPITLNNQSNDAPGAFGLSTLCSAMSPADGRSSMHRLWWAP